MEENRFLSAVRGSLVGGAVGDALGYPVEFMSWAEIRRTYGPAGIQRYEMDFEEDMALISDDTQMTLFTANGLLLADTCRVLGKAYDPVGCVYRAYLDWYECQRAMRLPPRGQTWLSALPEMHSRRAPGNTCLSALGSGKPGSPDRPLNDSKGCGGIMRAAPVALWDRGRRPLDEADRLGAASAALTHGHPLGYMSAAALVHLVSEAAFGGRERPEGLYNIAAGCREAMSRLYAGDRYLDELLRVMDRAVELSKNAQADADNIHAIGGGWTGEEALGIALYCSLKYQDDFSKGVTAAVNHSGDSDSTGAVTGNILGAWLGYEAIGKEWLDGLELKTVLLDMAQDLYTGCPEDKDALAADEAWRKKYAAYCE